MFAVKRIIRHRNLLGKPLFTSCSMKCDEFKVAKEEGKENTRVGKEQKLIHKGREASEKMNKNKNHKKKDVQRPGEAYKVAVAKSAAKELGLSKTNAAEAVDDLISYLKTFEVSKDPKDTEVTTVDTSTSLSSEIQLKSIQFKERLYLFHPDIMEEGVEGIKLKLWDQLEAEELADIAKVAPRNYFEELIRWTEEGKLWRFPIDNDQGLEKEAEISFTKHIFMEQYLEPWCPKLGPLRKFMELVLIGLAKNPYLTLEEKKNHIDWFKKYFEGKKKLLKELGAVSSPKEIESSAKEKIS